MQDLPKLPDLACCANCDKWYRNTVKRCPLYYPSGYGTEPRNVCKDWKEGQGWRVMTCIDDYEED